MKMSFREKLKAGGSKVVGSAMSVVLAVGLMPLPAFASDIAAASADLAAQADSKSVSGLLVGAAHAAANPGPDILGLSNPAARNANEIKTAGIFFGDEDYNENVDPFVWNYVNGGTPAAVAESWNGSPAAAMGTYASGEKAAAVWDQKPAVLLARGSQAADGSQDDWDFYDTEEYARAAETANKWEANSYHPLAVGYDFTANSTLIKTMYKFAEAATLVMQGGDYTPGQYGVQESGLASGTTYASYKQDVTTRYDETPLEIAKDYERYIVGQKGLVLKAIADGTVSMKTFAPVESYDATAGGYKVVYTEGYSTGTETTNRYIEGVQGVMNNLNDSTDAIYKTADQLRSEADLIVLTGADSADAALVAQLTADGLSGKTFYCTDWSAGSAFGTTHNSEENAQNVGRVLPCAYPEVLDQSDMIAYYYDSFYHIQTGKLNEFVAKNMKGVRNWDKTDSSAYTDWDASDVAGYDHDTVENMLKAGVAYLNSLGSLSYVNGQDISFLKPSNYLSADTSTLAEQTVTLSPSDPIKLDVGGSTSVTGTATNGATVSYLSDNTGVATVDGTGKITALAPGTATIIAKVPARTVNGTVYSAAAKSVKVTVQGTASISLANDTKVYTGKNLAYSGAVTKVGDGAVTYKYYSDAACTKSATPKSAGTYYVKGTVAGTTFYKTATSQPATLKITKAANTATPQKTSVTSKLKAKNLKKKAANVTLPKVTTKFGTATWSVSTKDGKKALSLKSGKVQVKKNTKKGTYTIKLKAKVKGTSNYAAATSKVVTVKVTVS